jgi:transcriptional antiterminator|tara:strand:+ start:725 stop:934 length:210 start_codon:yes stop_codon:yes gene_type:complete
MKLKDKMDEERVSVNWLSERLGLSRSTLIKYLNCPDEFRVKHVKIIAKYLHITQRDAIVNYFIKNQNHE